MSRRAGPVLLSIENRRVAYGGIQAVRASAWKCGGRGWSAGSAPSGAGNDHHAEQRSPVCSRIGDGDVRYSPARSLKGQGAWDLAGRVW